MMELQAHKGRHGDDGDTLRQASWEKAMPKLTQSGPSWKEKKGDDAIEANGVGRGGSTMPKSMQSSRMSTEAQAGFARPSNTSRTKAHVGVSNTGRTRERAPTTVTDDVVVLDEEEALRS